MPARLLEVGAMNTRFGRRLYLDVAVNGEVLKLFGSRKQLVAAVSAAGYRNQAASLEEGVMLDLPCRVTTKRSDDGRYVNVDQLLPAGNGRRR